MSETYVWTTSKRAAKGRLLADILELPLMIDGPVGDCDLVHIVGMPDSPGYPRTLAFTARAEERVIHWTASDARMIFEIDGLQGATHVCETPEAAATLSERGLESVVLPWPVRPNVEPGPLPQTPQITAYIGTNSFDFCLQVVQALDESLPDVELKAYAEGQADEAALAQIVRESSVHVRLASHDTDVHSSRVFMEAGRRVVMSHPLEHATVVRQDDLPQLVSAVRELLKETGPDLEAAAYWREINSEDWFKSRIEEVL